MNRQIDIAVIGAGIAGASIAAELAPHARLILVEAEDYPGYHSTGRSAAFWSESYGGPFIRPLTVASGLFLGNPPADFSDCPFLSPRGAIYLASSDDDDALRPLEEQFAESDLMLKKLGRRELSSIIPGLRPEWDRGLAEDSCRDIDVAALHAAYLKQARKHGAELVLNAKALQIERSPGGWRVHSSAGDFEATKIVNAAGAWADTVARMAGLPALDIRPHRRTMVQLRVNPTAAPDLPLIIDALGSFYFKPEAGGRLWLSPHDETPSEPGDCAPDEIDVALAVERLQQVVDWKVEKVERRWAGFRSFAPDRLPVYGYAAGRDDFFWFAGQGGFGIQTAPAAAKLAAALFLGQTPDPLVAGVDPDPYLAERFMN
ncbi:MAG: FAD-binding oxidoreductase [Sphingosinicella sp.]|nr:FAD-binding oxidoreductase [Sphingosinicella sp.]